MPRAPKKNPKPAHRPQKEIKWDIVDELLEAGCSGVEIASYLVCTQILYTKE